MLTNTNDSQYIESKRHNDDVKSRRTAGGFGRVRGRFCPMQVGCFKARLVTCSVSVRVSWPMLHGYMMFTRRAFLKLVSRLSVSDAPHLNPHTVFASCVN